MLSHPWYSTWGSFREDVQCLLAGFFNCLGSRNGLYIPGTEGLGENHLALSFFLTWHHSHLTPSSPAFFDILAAFYCLPQVMLSFPQLSKKIYKILQYFSLSIFSRSLPLPTFPFILMQLMAFDAVYGILLHLAKTARSRTLLPMVRISAYLIQGGTLHQAMHLLLKVYRANT